MAEEDFRSNDRDGNGEHDYWRLDVAGLYRLAGENGEALHLIEESLAAADDRAETDLEATVDRESHAGFWFRAIRHAGETAPDPRRFAACCFPETYGPGIRGTYIISEAHVVYKKDLGHGRGIDFFPADPPKEGWEKLD